MKKIFLNSIFGLFTFFIILGFNTTNIYAQNDPSGMIVAGPGLSYGSEIEKLGISVDGYYSIDDKIRVGAGITYFFPEKTTVSGTEFTSNFLTVNLNANYFFYAKDELSAYGIAGLNFAFASVEGGGGSASNNEVGLNLGVGGEYALDFGNIFTEIKLAGLAGDADQLVIGAGVRFGL